MKFTHL